MPETFNKSSTPSPARRRADEGVEMIAGYPTPPTPRRRPVTAIVAVLKLIANKEDTRQVFEASHALSGRSAKDYFDRFVAHPYGHRVVDEPVRLEEVFGRREWLAGLPDGSLGRAYRAFMEEEGLTPDGVLDAGAEAGLDLHADNEFEAFQRAMAHMEVAHDFWHVLTGYGRDALGEACVLAFTDAQVPHPGLRLIARVAALAAKAEQPGQPVLRALKEARRRGLAAEWFPTIDIEAFAPLPLDDARRRLNVAPPTVYASIPEEVRRGLLKPRVKRTQSEREADAVSVH